MTRKRKIDLDDLEGMGEERKSTVVISKARIKDVLLLKYRAETYKKNWDETQSEIKKLEQEILTELKAGAKVESGASCVIRKFKRLVISWKTEFEKRLGKAAVEEISRDPKRKKDFEELVMSVEDK